MPVHCAIEAFASIRDMGESHFRASRQPMRQGAGAGEADELGFLIDRGKDGFLGADTANGQALNGELPFNLSPVSATMN